MFSSFSCALQAACHATGIVSHCLVFADFKTASVTYSVANPSRKVGAAARLLTERKKKIGDLVNEGVFVADLQSRNPPVLHVRMVAVGDVNALPAA